MVKFENREIWADLQNRSKVVHSENFPIWRPASGDRDHVTHHVTSHVTHWGQWKYASRSWHAVGNHRRQLKLMYRSKISGRGPKHCSGSKFQCRPRPDWFILHSYCQFSWTCFIFICFGGVRGWVGFGKGVSCQIAMNHKVLCSYECGLHDRVMMNLIVSSCAVQLQNTTSVNVLSITVLSDLHWFFL